MRYTNLQTYKLLDEKFLIKINTKNLIFIQTNNAILFLRYKNSLCLSLCSSKFFLILEISRFCSESISTARTPNTFPLNVNFTNLTSFLPRSISTSANWLLSLESYAGAFACHKHTIFLNYLKIYPCQILADLNSDNNVSYLNRIQFF